MLGTAKVKKVEGNKFAVACELSDVKIRDNRVIGDEVIVELLYKSADNLISIGRYMEKLPADVVPTPPKEKKVITPALASDEVVSNSKRAK